MLFAYPNAVSNQIPFAEMRLNFLFASDFKQ